MYDCVSGDLEGFLKINYYTSTLNEMYNICKSVLGICIVLKIIRLALAFPSRSLRNTTLLFSFKAHVLLSWIIYSSIFSRGDPFPKFYIYAPILPSSHFHHIRRHTPKEDTIQF